MKKTYCKPVVEIEEYTLSESIAGCGEKVNFGPKNNDGSVCDGFPEDIFNMTQTASLFDESNPFYSEEDGMGDPCECYYTSGNHSYFQS